MIIPGIIVLPVQSSTLAFAGTFVVAELPIAVITPFVMTNVWSGLDGPPVPSVIFAWTSASVSVWIQMYFFTSALYWPNAGDDGTSETRNSKATKQHLVLDGDILFD